ncbi:MAG: hypothetical protein P1U86_04115 [Verrucomicrobiales bacterium]|nr:hypothetical protein [Verrucomicrobiales bacterium]
MIIQLKKSFFLSVFLLLVSTLSCLSEIKDIKIETIRSTESDKLNPHWNLEEYEYFLVTQSEALKDVEEVGFIRQISLEQRKIYKLRKNIGVEIDEDIASSQFFILRRPGKEDAIPYEVVQAGYVNSLIKYGQITLWHTVLDVSIELNDLFKNAAFTDFKMPPFERADCRLRQKNDKHIIFGRGAVQSETSGDNNIKFRGFLYGVSVGTHWCEVTIPLGEGFREMLRFEFLVVITMDHVKSGVCDLRTDEIYKVKYEFSP